jgi:hypothetical protein
LYPWLLQLKFKYYKCCNAKYEETINVTKYDDKWLCFCSVVLNSGSYGQSLSITNSGTLDGGITNVGSGPFTLNNSGTLIDNGISLSDTGFINLVSLHPVFESSQKCMRCAPVIDSGRILDAVRTMLLERTKIRTHIYKTA